MFDCFCIGSNWCYVVVYSVGDLMIGYMLLLYGGSICYKKNVLFGLDGVCVNSDGMM